MKVQREERGVTGTKKSMCNKGEGEGGRRKCEGIKTELTRGKRKGKVRRRKGRGRNH